MEDFVPFEIAIKIKENGFNIPFYFYYRTDDKLLRHANITNPLVYGDEVDDEVIIAPTISQVLKWLRKEKKIHIVCPFYRDKGFYYYVQEIGNAARIVSSFGDDDDCFNSYEQAAITGIQYVLDNIL